jgi:hypothetical protein
MLIVDKYITDIVDVGKSYKVTVCSLTSGHGGCLPGDGSWHGLHALNGVSSQLSGAYVLGLHRCLQSDDKRCDLAHAISCLMPCTRRYHVRTGLATSALSRSFLCGCCAEIARQRAVGVRVAEGLRPHHRQRRRAFERRWSGYGDHRHLVAVAQDFGRQRLAWVLRFTVVDNSDFSLNRLTVSTDSPYPSL